MTATTPRRPAWLLGELRAPAELGLFLGAFPLLHAAPRGRARPVLVLPGFVASDSSTLPLRVLLGRLGHQPLSWGLGTNFGPTAETIDGIVRRLHEAAELAGEPVPLVGWSLGGIYARALALWHPELVDQVISLGSPFNIGHREPTSLDPLWDVLGRRQKFVGHRGQLELDQVPCPSTALFSRTDGVVAWQSCRQTEQQPGREHRGAGQPLRPRGQRGGGLRRGRPSGPDPPRLAAVRSPGPAPAPLPRPRPITLRPGPLRLHAR